MEIKITTKEMSARVLQSVGSGYRVLEKYIPSLWTFSGDDFPQNTSDATDTSAGLGSSVEIPSLQVGGRVIKQRLPLGLLLDVLKCVC